MQTMLETVEEHAWVYVVDMADTLPQAHNIPASQWLQVIGAQERQRLAVTKQVERLCAIAWEQAADRYGPESQSAVQASVKLQKAAADFEKTVAQVLTGIKQVLTDE